MMRQQEALSTEKCHETRSAPDRISRNLDLAVKGLVMPWAERLSAIDPLAQIFTAGSSATSQNESVESKRGPLSDLDLLVLAPSLHDPATYVAALELLKNYALEFQKRSDLRPVFFTHAAQKHAWVALAKAYHTEEIVPVHFLFYPTEDVLRAREGKLGERLLANATLVHPADLPISTHGPGQKIPHRQGEISTPLSPEFIFRWEVECVLADFVLNYPGESQANQNMRCFALADLGQVLKKSLVNWVGPHQPFESEIVRSYLSPPTHAEFKSLVLRLLQEDFSPSPNEVKRVCSGLLDALPVAVHHKVAKTARRVHQIGSGHTQERREFVELLRAHPETTIRLAERMRVLDGVGMETLMPVYNTFGDWPFEVLNLDMMGWERFVARSAERRERTPALSLDLNVVDLLANASVREFSQEALEVGMPVSENSLINAAHQDTRAPHSLALCEALAHSPRAERERKCRELGAIVSEEECIGGLSSETAVIRRRAAELSGYCALGVSHLEKIVQVASNDKDVGVRAWAVWALARGAPQERRAVETIGKMVTATNASLAETAFKALQDIGPQAEPAIPYLKQLLNRRPALPEVWRIEAVLTVVRSMGPLGHALIPDLVESARLVLLNARGESRIAFAKRLEDAIAGMTDAGLMECLASYPSNHARADYEHGRACGLQKEPYTYFGAVIKSVLGSKSTVELETFMSKYSGREELCHVQWVIWDRHLPQGHYIQTESWADGVSQD